MYGARIADRMVAGLDDVAKLGQHASDRIVPSNIRAMSARLVTAPPDTTKLVVAAVVSGAACIELIRSGGASIRKHVPLYRSGLSSGWGSKQWAVLLLCLPQQ